MLSHSISFGNDGSDMQLIDDLNALCKRHKIHCGGPSDLKHLPSDLANDNFRIDLFTLCTVISHMAETDLSPQQLLVLVARAIGGPEVSIKDADDLPPDATSTFIEGYERWTQRDPALDGAHDRDQKMASESEAGPYHTAASLSSSYLLAMQEGSTTFSANGTSGRRSIPSNTPLENLTLNELRMYLEDIENRVRRIGPHLDRIAHEAAPTAAPALPEALVSQPAPENKAIADLPAEAFTESVVPADSTGLTTEASPSSPAIQPDAGILPVLPLPAKAPKVAGESSHLHRLRIFNTVLICLLLLVCTAAAIVANRYLYSRPQPHADALHESTSPAVDLSLVPIPSALTNGAQQSDAASPTRSSAPAPAHQPDDAATKKSSAASPSASPPTFVGTMSRREDPPPPQGETAKTSSPPTNSLETSTPSHLNQPTPTPAATDNQNHPPPKAVPVAATIGPAKATPERPPAPAVTLSTVAAKSGFSPPDAPTRAPLPHPIHPADSPVVVPRSMMMAYAIATPEPIYPSFLHSPTARTVEVAVNISKEGKVTGARVISGGVDVSAAAVHAVQYWRFKPFVLDGNPVQVVTTLKFVFEPR
jgi:periplasmic protein TonB